MTKRRDHEHDPHEPHEPHASDAAERATDAASDRFLSDVQTLAESDAPAGASRGELVAVLADALTPTQPSSELRSRILSGALLADRFARFAQDVALLLDLSTDKAQRVLARIDEPSGWSVELPGVSFLWVEGGPRVQDAVRGFVRVQAGLSFPVHEHLGDEIVLVLQGAFVDSITGAVHGAGSVVGMAAGTSHGFVVPEGGPDLLKLAVVHKGLRAGDKRYDPR